VEAVTEKLYRDVQKPLQGGTPVGLKMRPDPDLDGEGVQPMVQYRLGAVVGPLQRQNDSAVAYPDQ
jgi:hypothetical protein